MNKQVVLIISGGIAAYRALDLIRLLRQRRARVTVVTTESALKFVTPLSLQALSGEPIHSHLWRPSLDDGMDHIHLTREADLLLIAPATANFLARMAAGLADDLATALILAYDGPVLAAPAMNVRMWQHPATQRNVDRLKDDGVRFVGPESGALACGEAGIGRLAAVGQIVEAAQTVLTPSFLAGRHLLITAGPTQEALDPVRYISNHSSGKMGLGLCRAALRAGARVTLIHGPLTQEIPAGADARPVTSAQEMFDAALACWREKCDGAILTAAVGDYRPLVRENEKIKKRPGVSEHTLTLTTNPDILATLAQQGEGRVVVGFAAETGQALIRGKEKMVRKRCDLLVINDLLEKGAGFAVDTNRVTLLDRDGQSEPWPLLPKEEVAERLMKRIALLLEAAQT